MENCKANHILDKSSHRRCSVRKDVLRNLAKFTGKHLCLFMSGPKACNFIKKRLWNRCFLVNFCEIFKKTFCTEHPRATASVQSKQAKRLLRRKHLYKGLAMNNCSVDVSAIKNIQNQQKYLKQQIRLKIPTISALQVFSLELHPQFHSPGSFLYSRNTQFQNHLRVLFKFFFLAAMIQEITLFCFFKNKIPSTFFLQLITFNSN